MAKRINLALQGGGAHGAFTWGVLDRLLEESELEVAGISGTSAGALNGAAYKGGWMQDGCAGARKNLDWLWGQMGALDDMRMPTWMTGATIPIGQVSQALELSPQFMMADAMSRVMSPYFYGPFYKNPLESVVREFAYDRVCADAGPALFVGRNQCPHRKDQGLQGQGYQCGQHPGLGLPAIAVSGGRN